MFAHTTEPAAEPSSPSTFLAGASHAASPLMPKEFLRLSTQSKVTLVGVAAASLDNAGTILFFADSNRITAEHALPIATDRIREIELLEPTPLTNTPLPLPSVWRVRMELSPVEPKRSRIETTFES